MTQAGGHVPGIRTQAVMRVGQGLAEAREAGSRAPGWAGCCAHGGPVSVGRLMVGDPVFEKGP